MDENKKKKVILSGQVRLPEELDREMDMERAKLGLFKYEVIERAWLAYKVAQKGYSPLTTSGSVAVPISEKHVTTSLQPGSRVVPYSTLMPGEAQWVTTVLRVFRSRKKLSNALKSILLELEALAERYERESAGNAMSHRTSEPIGHSANRTELDEIERSVKEIEKGNKEATPRKKRPPREGGGRR